MVAAAGSAAARLPLVMVEEAAVAAHVPHGDDGMVTVTAGRLARASRSRGCLLAGIDLRSGRVTTGAAFEGLAPPTAAYNLPVDGERRMKKRTKGSARDRGGAALGEEGVFCATVTIHDELCVPPALKNLSLSVLVWAESRGVGDTVSLHVELLRRRASESHHANAQRARAGARRTRARQKAL